MDAEPAFRSDMRPRPKRPLTNLRECVLLSSRTIERLMKSLQVMRAIDLVVGSSMRTTLSPFR